MKDLLRELSLQFSPTKEHRLCFEEGAPEAPVESEGETPKDKPEGPKDAEEAKKAGSDMLNKLFGNMDVGGKGFEDPTKGLDIKGTETATQTAQAPRSTEAPVMETQAVEPMEVAKEAKMSDYEKAFEAAMKDPEQLGQALTTVSIAMAKLELGRDLSTDDYNEKAVPLQDKLKKMLTNEQLVQALAHVAAGGEQRAFIQNLNRLMKDFDSGKLDQALVTQILENPEQDLPDSPAEYASR